MSKALIKSGNVVVKNEEKRVIDSNQMISERLKFLTEILENSSNEDIFDGFSEGLDALSVERLLEDPDAEGAPESIPQVDEAELQRMIDEANEQAEAIVSDANAQASSIIEGARQEAERIKEESRQAGHKEGYNTGYKEGLAATKEIEDSLKEKALMMDADYEEKISLLEPRFVDVLTDIYAHIFSIELKDKEGLVKYLLKDAIRNIESKRNLFIHVSKEDYKEVNDAKDELSEGLASSITIEVIEDITLSKSNCYIEADSGIYDCSLGTELELLKKELMLLSYRKES